MREGSQVRWPPGGGVGTRRWPCRRGRRRGRRARARPAAPRRRRRRCRRRRPACTRASRCRTAVRCGPKQARTCSTYGRRSSTDQLDQSASVTRPESLHRHVRPAGQPGELGGPRLHDARGDGRLGEVVEHEPALGHQGGHGRRGREVLRPDQQVEGEAACGHRAQAGDHVGAEQPVGVGLVLDEAAEADQVRRRRRRRAAGRAARRRRARSGRRSPTTPLTIGEPAARSEQLLGLVDVGHGLHDDRVVDAGLRRSRRRGRRARSRAAAAPWPRRRSRAGRAPRGPTRGGGRRPAASRPHRAPGRSVGEPELARSDSSRSCAPAPACSGTR